MHQDELYRQKERSLEECLTLIRPGDRILAAAAASEPAALLDALPQVIPNLHDVELFKGRDNSYAFLRDPEVRGHLKVTGHFYSADLRQAHTLGFADYIPSNLHNFISERLAHTSYNVFVAQVTPPEQGVFQAPYCMMFEREAYEAADTVILEVNSNFRRVRGGLDIPVERVTAFFHSEKPIFTTPRSAPSPAEQTIARYVADLIHDGDTIQLGVGALPDMVGEYLKEKNDLGIHSEIFSSTMADLIESGNANGSRKTLNPGEHIAVFCAGDQHLFDVVAENPACRLVSSAYGNNPCVIAQNDHMVSVNSALEIDLTGQICSESIGPLQYSGTGGASDFACGAMHARGGRGIIAFASTAKGGTISKIKSVLTPGAAVSISRNLADTIITEYGVAELRGRTIRERAEALIAIAHPDFRAQLRREAQQYGILA